MANLPSKIAAGIGGALSVVSLLVVSPGAIQRVQGHEGVRNTAYLDPVGIATICTGSTRDVKLGMKLSDRECAKRLESDLKVASDDVKRLVKVPLSQNQFDSLVSFTFNVGGGNLASSTLLHKINSGQCKAAAEQFDRWVYAKGVRLPGLVVRRKDERLWFEQDCNLWK